MVDGWYSSKMIVYYMYEKRCRRTKKENSFESKKDHVVKWLNYNWKKMTDLDNLIDE